MPVFMRPMGVMVDPDSAKRLAPALAEAITTQYGDDRTLQVVFEGRKRSGAENAKIAGAQAREGRNPFWFSDQTLKLIKSAVGDSYSKNSSKRQSAMARIKQAMLVGILDNAKKQLNPDGSTFRNVTAGYAKRKQRQFGFVRPLLRATGDLLDDLRVRIVNGDK